MNAQLDLLSASPIAAHGDPWTSHQAAAEVTADGSRARQQNAVLEAVGKAPGLTSAELAQYMNADRQMPARRLPELRAVGLVRNGTTRTCGITGKASLTWRPAE